MARLTLASFVALLLVFVISVAALATGSWGAITSSNSTTGSPGSGSDTSSWNDWTWSITGTNGSFTASAEAYDNWKLYLIPAADTGIQSASGYTQQTMGGWDPGNGTCQHVAPTNAKVTGQGDGNVTCSIHMDANNSDISSGSCSALGYAKISFTGVAPGACELNLNGSYTEGDTSVSGTLSSDPSVTITTTISSDVADVSGANSVSVSNAFTGNIAGTLQKGYGVVSVRGYIGNGAYDSKGQANTSITTCTLTKNYGGDAVCGDDPPHDSH